MALTVPRARRLAVGGCLLLVTLSACRGQQDKAPPVVPIRNMYNQPRYDPQEGSDFFPDGRTMRPLVPGVVAREMEISPEINTGLRADGGGWLNGVPPTVVRRLGGGRGLLTRGRERYNIYCAPCHSRVGDGEGMVSKRAVEVGAANLKAPTFHDDLKRQMPDGQIFGTISNGVRNMPAYKHSIPVMDRWAIVAYVRALQVSQSDRGETKVTEVVTEVSDVTDPVEQKNE